MSLGTPPGRKEARMFQSVEDLSQKLSETGYFIDPTMTKVVFLADQMKKPLLLEGLLAVAKLN
jgi:hypothetical protein